MLWPFGKGKVEIELNSYNFSPGDTIEGKASFSLKKPVKARAVNVRLVGVRKETNFNIKTRGSRTKTGYVFDFVQKLDGEKEYSGDLSYNFKIKIPSNVLNQPNFGGDIANTIVKSVQLLSGKSSYVKWYVVAYLDIPLGIDVSKKIQVNIA